MMEMNDICDTCQIEDCEHCSLWWNDDPTDSEMLMLFDE